MTLDLRPASSGDYTFALKLYLETIKPLAKVWDDWNDEEQAARFRSLWRPQDTWIVTLSERNIGWLEFRRTADEIFLKQLYIDPAHQRYGIGSRVLERIFKEHADMAKSIALFVLRNNSALSFYKRHGFNIVREISSTFVMRRALERVI